MHLELIVSGCVPFHIHTKRIKHKQVEIQQFTKCVQHIVFKKIYLHQQQPAKIVQNNNNSNQLP